MVWKRSFFWLDIYQFCSTQFWFSCLWFSGVCCSSSQCKIDARWRVIHCFDNELIPIANEQLDAMVKMQTIALCSSKSVLLSSSPVSSSRKWDGKREFFSYCCWMYVAFRCVYGLMILPFFFFPLEQKRSNSYRIKKKFYHVNGARDALICHIPLHSVMVIVKQSQWTLGVAWAHVFCAVHPYNMGPWCRCLVSMVLFLYHLFQSVYLLMCKKWREEKTNK